MCVEAVFSQIQSPLCLGTPPATFDSGYKDSKDKHFCHTNITPLQFYEQFVKLVFNMSDKVSPSQTVVTNRVGVVTFKK